MPWRLLLCAGVALLTSVHAVFVDEAFHVDYHQALLGIPLSHTTFFHRPQFASNASLLYTISDKAVIGAVNPKDGSILWRHSLAPYQIWNSTDAFITAADDGTIVSGYGGEVSAWDALNGKLAWSYNLPEGQAVRGVREIPATESAGQGVAVLSTGTNGGASTVSLIGKDEKKARWTYTEGNGDLPVGLYTAGNHLYAISKSSALLSSGRMKVVALDPSNGAEVKQTTLSISPDSLLDSAMNCPYDTGLPLLVSAEAPFKSIKLGVVEGGKVLTATLTDKNEEIDHLDVHQACEMGFKSAMLVSVRSKTKQWAEVFHVDRKSGTVTSAYSLPATGENSVFAVSNVAGTVYFTRITDTEVSLYSAESHGLLGRWPRRRTGPTTSPETRESHAIAEVVTRGKSGAAVRVAEMSGNGEWSLIRNGDTQWTRPEFLANTKIAVWAGVVDADTLAAELETEISINPLIAYVHRVQRHIDALKHLPLHLMHVVEGLLDPSKASPDSGNSLVGSKTIIIATSRLEVAALNAVEFGSVRWRTSLSTTVSASAWIISLSVHASRVTAHLSDGSFTVLNLTNGSIVEHMDSAIPAKKIVELPGQPHSTVVKIDKDGTPSLPSDFSPSTATEGNVLVTIGQNGEAMGWTIGQSVQKTWVIHPAKGKFVDGVARAAYEPVSSIGKVKGDRSVLYKYLSPNLALLTAKSDTTDVLSVYLVDSVTGDILHVASHAGFDSNSHISSAISENWFAYSFTAKDAETHATTSYIIAAELYESQNPNDRGRLNDVSNYSSIAPGSSTKPHVISQSFIISEPISHMSVSQTGQGITNRQLLCTLPESGAIIGIHRYMLDPRRPVGRDPTALELEEGLIRYTPVLELDPKLYLSHSREVLGITKLMSSPSLLESTSLVFGFGHDIFGTRVTPSMAFDVLGKGFSRMQLTLTVAALAVGTVILAPLVKRRQAEGRWKM